MRDLAEVLRFIAWPLVALIFFFRFDAGISLVVEELAKLVARVKKVKLPGGGSLELAEELSRELARPSEPAGAAVSPNDTRGDFERLVAEYDELNEPNDATRAQRRNAIADQLCKLARSLSIPRAELARSTKEGYLVALATAALTEPEKGDLQLLEQASINANFNFTRYRIVLAIIPSLSSSKMIKRKLVKPTLQTAARVLTNCETRPDFKTNASLRRVIEKTRSAIDEITDRDR